MSGNKMPTDQTWAEEMAAGMLEPWGLDLPPDILPAVAAALVEAEERGSMGRDSAIEEMEEIADERDAALEKARGLEAEVKRLAGAVRYYEETVCLPGSPLRLELMGGGEAKPIETVRLKDLLAKVERLRDVVRAVEKLPWQRDEKHGAGLRFGGTGQYGGGEFYCPEVTALWNTMQAKDLRDALAAVREETPND